MSFCILTQFWRDSVPTFIVCVFCYVTPTDLSGHGACSVDEGRVCTSLPAARCGDGSQPDKTVSGFGSGRKSRVSKLWWEHWGEWYGPKLTCRNLTIKKCVIAVLLTWLLLHTSRTPSDITVIQKLCIFTQKIATYVDWYLSVFNTSLLQLIRTWSSISSKRRFRCTRIVFPVSHLLCMWYPHR